jgi:large subunit ribosomal protein L22
MSARKVRPIADLIRGKYADDALDILRYQPHRGARLIEKVLRSALGNAADPDNPQNRGKVADVRDLVVAEIAIDGGPMMKRIRPRARGMAFMIKKRSSHIRVKLERASEVRGATAASSAGATGDEGEE